jgi:4-azaleucine resistance transporter AzlC
VRAGFKAGLPIAVASILIGISFGVLAEPVMGTVAPVVMSAVVFAGSAQFAALAVLAAGGGAGAAIVAGVLLNARFLPMGLAIGPSREASWWRRALAGQAVIDIGWALAKRGPHSFDVPYMIGISAANYPAWVAGTAVGVLAGEAIGDPGALGLDVLFPAFFLGLLAVEVSGSRRAMLAAALGAAIALALAPSVPPGVPVIAACAAALIGLRPEARA